MFGNIGVRSKVLEILENNPSIPYSVVGSKVGVTRERVRQIARQCGYPPRNGILSQKICPVCGQAFNKKINTYCSRSCGYEARRKRIIVNCCQCGKFIEQTPASMRSKSGRYFCSRRCYGKWVKKIRHTETRNKKLIVGDFKHEIGLKAEFPL